MDFKTYQKDSRQTAKYIEAGSNFIYPTLGLASEAGEVAGKVKKIMRDDGMNVSEEKREQIKDELGDVLWYVAQVATEFNLDLEEIAKNNLDKLLSRMERGVLGGSGANR